MTKDEAVEAVAQFTRALESVPDGMFNGAFLMLPPGDGVKIDGLFAASKPDGAAFWVNCVGTANVEVETIKNAERDAGARYGRR